MTERDEQDFAALLAQISVQLGQLTSAIERSNELEEQKMKCPSCMGSRKGYDGHRCVPCGGSGVRSFK